MSEPKNHHYVSQCQIRNFFNHEEGKIYLYDKELDNFYSKRTTKSIFSKTQLNSRAVEGKVDNTSLEHDLKKHFEDNFDRSVQIVSKVVLNPQQPEPKLKEALYDLVKFGLIGEFRTPSNKSELQDLVNSAFFQLGGDFENFIKQKAKEEPVKYWNYTLYSDMAVRLLEKMGDLNFTILHFKCNGTLLLPDCSSVTKRARINNYFNPDIEEIAIVGIPITDNIYVEATSNKLKKRDSQVIPIEEENSKLLLELNRLIYLTARKAVACKDEKYLRDFVDKVKQD